MAALATNRKLDLGSFILERSAPSHGSNSASKNSTSNGDNLHEQASANAHMEKNATTSRLTADDHHVDDLENNTQNSKGDNNLPPERQLGKLKRFLQTVYRFAEDLTSQKDRVKQLMVDLINADVSAQEFYLEMRGSTKFPLRPFVVPFLESSLHLLHTSMNLPLKVDTLESELFDSAASVLGIGYKRNASEKIAATQNGLDRKRRATVTSPDKSGSPSPKRQFTNQQHSTSNSSSSRSTAYPNLVVTSANGNGNGSHCSTLRDVFPNTLIPAVSASAAAVSTTNGNGSNGTSNASASASNGLVGLSAATAAAVGSRPAELTAAVSAFQQAGGNGNPTNVDWWTCQTDEWRNIETLFSTMATTMERLRYALLLFQQRARLTQLWNEKFQQHQRLHDSNLKIEEMQRRADAAVQEVKRAAVTELQKAVHAAEQKALHMIATERAQMEKLLRDTQVQEEGNETCRNCGRRAGQTCSGCGKARYCGVFCQHKDWPRHRSTCSGVNDANGSNAGDYPAAAPAPAPRAENDVSTEESRSPPVTIKREFSAFASSPTPSTKKERVSPKSV